jgi:hypothetical protein
LEELADGEGAGRFVAVDAGGEVKAAACGRRCSAQGEQLHAEAGREALDRPTVALGGGENVTQDGVDVDRLAVIAIVVAPQALHGRRQ